MPTYRQYPSGMREVVVQEPPVLVPTRDVISFSGTYGAPLVHSRSVTPARSRYQQTARDLVDITRAVVGLGMLGAALWAVARLAVVLFPTVSVWPLWLIGLGFAAIWVARDA